MDLSEGLFYLWSRFEKVFLSASSIFSLTSLACALCLAVAFVVIKRRRKNRRLRLRTIARALFPKRITANPSHTADVGYFFLNVLVFALLFGWAVLSYQVLSNAIVERLVAAFGPAQASSLPDIVTRSVITLTLFLAYEFGYWLNHYLSHKVPFLWEFHKVHHSANVLTPLTNFRIHPVDGLLSSNIIAITLAVASGTANYLFGKTTYQYAVNDSNLLFVLFVHAWLHLQHTHLWIPFRGVWGRILLSPAHHQVHHSDNPVHFDKNLGGSLAVWDWLFGTLHIPAKEREKLSFGVEQNRKDVHAVGHGLADPFWRAALQVRGMFQRTTHPAKPEIDARTP